MKFIYVLFAMWLTSGMVGCGSSSSTPTIENGHLGGLIDGEGIGETRSGEFTGNDMRLHFNNGAAFVLPALENLNAETGTVTIRLLEQERFFNTDQDLVFDLSGVSGNYQIRFEYPLPADIESDDISLYLYSPSTSVEEFEGLEVAFTYDRGSGRLIAALPSPTGAADLPQHHARSHSILSEAYMRLAELRSIPVAGIGAWSMLAHRDFGDTDSKEQDPRLDRSSDKVPKDHGDANYSRLVLSWQTREDLAENDLRKVIQMPFYEQSAETCWAACAKMMGRAYSAVNNRDREIRIHDVVKYMRHHDFEAGLGIFAFRTYLPRYLNTRTGIEYEVSSFLLTSRLRSEIIRHLNNNRPVILNFSYPDVGKHQILVVGYELTQESLARATLNLLYHNPQNTDGDIYRWAPFDWLMKDKWPQELVQILYADQPAPDNRALQTLGTPVFGKPLVEGGQALGELAFMSYRAREADGRVLEIPIHPVYDHQARYGYGWVERVPEDGLLNVIPATARHILLQQIVFNAAAESQTVYIIISATDTNTWERVHQSETMETFAPGNNRLDEIIPLKDFFDPDRERSLMLEIRLEDAAGRYLDGYTFRFSLASKAFTEIGLGLSLTINGEEQITFKARPEIDREARSEIRTREFNLILPNIDMEGDGRLFTGQHTRQPGNNPDSTETVTVHLALDDVNNLNEIRSLTYQKETHLQTIYNSSVHTTRILFNSIPVRKEDKSVLGGIHYRTEIQRDGTAVCSAIGSIEHQSRNTSLSAADSDLLSYDCDSGSELMIRLFHDF